MKRTRVFIFLIIIVMVSYSCKKKRAVSPIILEKYDLQVMLHLYPEDGTSGGGADGSTDGEDVSSIVELSISGVDTLYTETNISAGTPITIESGQTISLNVKAKNTTDTIYVGGYVIEDIQNHSPISNGTYTYSFTASENKLLIIGLSKDADNDAVEYKAFQLGNTGRGQTQMYVYTNYDARDNGDTENALTSYRVPSKLISTITLPEVAIDSSGYGLGLKAIADSTYSLDKWFPMGGISPSDTDGVIYPVTPNIKNSTLAYVNGGDIDANTIETPLELKAIFSDTQNWDGIAKEEPIRKGKNYYVISLASHLAWVAHQVNISDGGFHGYIFEFENDIDFHGKDFTGIATGTRGTPFQGTFDGKGKSIRNARFIFDSSANYDNNGFVGKLGINGSISNLTIADSVIVESIGGNSLGAIVGRNNGKVINCTNFATIDASGDVITAYYVGGIVGYNDGGTISNVRNVGMVSNALHSVGGVVGYNNKGKLSYAYNEGLITANRHVGGVVGIASQAISQVYNDGIVSNSGSSKTEPKGEYTGGVVGLIAETGAQITDVYNTGEVIGGDYSGGILGHSVGGAITLDKCYNIGVVYGNTDTTGGIIGGTSASTTFTGGVTASLQDLYFLKDSTYNVSIGNTGIGVIENTTYTDNVDRHLANAGFATIANFSNDTRGIWIVKGSGHGLTAVNGVTDRFLLVGLLGNVR